MDLYNLIWDEQLWFPDNRSGVRYGWKDLVNKAGSPVYYPQLPDLNWALVIAVLMITVRYALDR